MSIRIMSAIWDNAPHAEGELLVLLALADFCNDGGVCWPSIPQIARKARLTERQTFKVIRALENAGTISVSRGGGRGRVNTYKVNKFHPSSVLESINPELCSMETLNSVTINPELSDTY